MTTAWYIDQSKKLDAVTRDLRVGNPVKHAERLRKIDKAIGVVNSFKIGGNFEGSDLIEAIQKAQTSILELFREAVIKQFNKVYESN